MTAKELLQCIFWQDFFQKFAVLITKMAPHSINSKRCVAKFFEKHGNGNKKATVEHFAKEGVPRITIYKILQRLGKCGTFKWKVGSGHKATIMMSKKVEALCKTFNLLKYMSYHVTAQKFKCSKTLVHYTSKKSPHC